jgi:hypothetical protein
MSRLSCSRPAVALAGLLLLLAGVGLLPTSQPPAAPPVGSACLLLSPNVDEGLDLAEARRRLSTREHARYRRLAGDILGELGIHQLCVHDALGEWQGGVENSLLVVLAGPADPGTLSCAAACFGLAARQKAVLAFHADPSGPDALVYFEMPGQSLAAVRDLLDRHGLRERTLLRGAGGWRAVVLVSASEAATLADLAGGRLHVQPGRAVLLGEPTRAGASERYRQVIHAYRAAHPAPRLVHRGR